MLVASKSNSVEFSLIDALFSPIINIFLAFFGLSLFTMDNNTSFDIMVTVNEPRSASLFHEENTVHDWDVFVVRKQERQFFTISFFSSIKYIVSGIPMEVSKGFSFLPGSIAINEERALPEGDSSYDLVFVNKRCRVEVSETPIIDDSQFVSNEDLDPNDVAILQDIKENGSGVTSDDRERRAVLWCHGHSCHIAVKRYSGNQDINKRNVNTRCHVSESSKIISRVAAIAFTMKFYSNPVSKECPKTNTLSTQIADEQLIRIQNSEFMDENDFAARDYIIKYMKTANVDYLKYFARRIVDFYNEYALLIVEATKTELSVLNITTLVFASISTSLGNGGRGYPASKPGSVWFGPGKENYLIAGMSENGEEIRYQNRQFDEYVKCGEIIVIGDKAWYTSDKVRSKVGGRERLLDADYVGQHCVPVSDDFRYGDERNKYVRDSMYVDSMLRASVPLLLTSLMNLAVLGSIVSRRRGWAERMILCTSEAYLVCFTFSLICAIENTSREPPGCKPLASLKHSNYITGVAVTLLCQVLCLFIPVLINVMLVYTPSHILVPAMGAFVFYCGIFFRFIPEPVTLMFAWRRSNMCFMLGVCNQLVTAIFELNRIRWRAFYESYVRDFINNYLYLFCFAATIVITLLLQYRVIV